MADDPTRTRPLDWSTGTLETCYYLALKEIDLEDANEYSDNDFLGWPDLSDIIVFWNKKYSDKYQLYIFAEDDNEIRIEGDIDPCAKPLLLRRSEADSWDVCCHFEAGTDVAATSLRPSLAKCIEMKLSLGGVQEETRCFSAHTTSQALSNAINDRCARPTCVSSAKLDEELEKLTSAIEKLVLSIEKRNESDDRFRRFQTAIDKLTASLQNATQAHTSFDNVMPDRTSKTSTQDDSTSRYP